MHHLEDETVLVVRRAAEHVAVGCDDLVLEARVVETAVLEGPGLEGAAGDGPADGDRLELGHDDGGQAVPERREDEIGEGDARLGRAGPRFGVDLEDLVELADVDLLVGVGAVVPLGDLMGDRLLPERDDPSVPMRP